MGLFVCGKGDKNSHATQNEGKERKARLTDVRTNKRPCNRFALYNPGSWVTENVAGLLSRLYKQIM